MIIKPVIKSLHSMVNPMIQPLKTLVKPLTGGSHKSSAPAAPIPIFDRRQTLLARNRSLSDPKLQVPADNTLVHNHAQAVTPDDSYDEEIIEEEIMEEEYFEEEIIEEEIVEDDDDGNDMPLKITGISYDEFDEMFDVLHLSDYSKSEIAKTWYERSDFTKMVEECRKIAEKMEDQVKQIGKARSSKRDLRGLENWTTLGSSKVRLLKEVAMDGVWTEQMRQWDRHRANPEQIRMEYQKATKNSQVVAIQRAMADEAWVKEMYVKEELERQLKKRVKLLKKGKHLVGGSLKTTVKATGFVIKKTGQGVVTTGKITGKTGLAVATLDRKGLMEIIKKTGHGVVTTGKITGKTGLAVATLDRKGLMEAIRNKKKERGCVEGYAYRRKSLSSRDSTPGPVEEGGEEEAKSVKGENTVIPTGEKEAEQNPVVIGVERITPQSSDKLDEKSEHQSPGRADKKSKVEAAPLQSSGKGDKDKIVAALPQSPVKEKNKVKATLPQSPGKEKNKIQATRPRSPDKEKNKIQATLSQSLGKNDEMSKMPTVDHDEPACDDYINNSSCMSGVSLVSDMVSVASEAISEASGNTSENKSNRRKWKVVIEKRKQKRKERREKKKEEKEKKKEKTEAKEKEREEKKKAKHSHRPEWEANMVKSGKV